MSGNLEGGCACGAVRYRLASAPYDAGWCHCRLCQRTSGAPAVAFATVRRDDYVVTAETGAVGEYASTHFGRRGFCTRCGTLLTIAIDFQLDEIDVAAATLDDPDAVTPAFHIFCEEAIGWAPIDDGLPRHDRFRPDTRGLEAGQTYPA